MNLPLMKGEIHNLKSAFGKVLRGYREKAGYSQEQLALECGLDRTFISLLERGLRQPSLESIFTLAEKLDITPSKLLQDVEKELK